MQFSPCKTYNPAQYYFTNKRLARLSFLSDLSGSSVVSQACITHSEQDPVNGIKGHTHEIKSRAGDAKLISQFFFPGLQIGLQVIQFSNTELRGETKLLQLLCTIKQERERLGFICTQNEHPQSVHSIWEQLCVLGWVGFLIFFLFFLPSPLSS